MVDKKFFLIAGGVVILDQIIKFLVRFYLDATISVTSFLDFTLVKNFGAGFGILQGQRLLLIVIPVIVAAGIIYFHKKLVTKELERYGYALVLGGAVGNLLDRIVLGWVTDFINFSFWPAFNVADSAISIGVVLLIIQEFRKN
jgi:signal peptidase II